MQYYLVLVKIKQYWQIQGANRAMPLNFNHIFQKIPKDSMSILLKYFQFQNSIHHSTEQITNRPFHFVFKPVYI